MNIRPLRAHPDARAGQNVADHDVKRRIDQPGRRRHADLRAFYRACRAYRDAREDREGPPCNHVSHTPPGCRALYHTGAIEEPVS